MKKVWCFAGKRISEEEGNNRLAPSSTNVAVGAVRVLELLNTLNCAVQLLLCWVAGRLKQLNLNTQAQSVCSYGAEFSDVINSGLELVMIPSRLH